MGIGIPLVVHDDAIVNLVLPSLSLEVVEHIHHPGEIGVIGHVGKIGRRNLGQRDLVAPLAQADLLKLTIDQIDIDDRKGNGQEDDDKGDFKNDRFSQVGKARII